MTKKQTKILKIAGIISAIVLVGLISFVANLAYPLPPLR